MDSLPESRAIFESLPETFSVYEPLLNARRHEILSTPKSTHQYGSHPRQYLDLYKPASITETTPLLLWIYGGGLVNGDKTLIGPQEQFSSGIVYANIAHYFVKTFGFLVAVVDYRLIKHDARYPSGGEDIGLALQWLGQHLKSERSTYLIGNSAGGAHLATWLFAPELADLRRHTAPLKVKAVVFLSVPFDQDSALLGRADTNKRYYGNPEQIRQRVPTALLVSADDVSRSIRVLAINGSLDPEDEILEPLKRFLLAAKENDLEVDSRIVYGHNHISPSLSLGTGIPREEEWGLIAGNWLLKQ